ncbi:hypothetical protein a10_07391 [Streptomyces acidiscabies]|nr:hypothetical protein a10_07391 [Streptomyces acidiscabies]GAV40682.1 hypothetical protein Saa2_03577 [Streptomyces acidiscabies]
MTWLKLGHWLWGEKGPCDGLAAAAVDCLNTGYKMRDEGKLLVIFGHDGPWNLDDSVDENRFTMEAWGAQMELRAIQRRNRSATEKTRATGRPKGKPSYGFQQVVSLVMVLGINWRACSGRWAAPGRFRGRSRPCCLLGGSGGGRRSIRRASRRARR